MSNQNDNMTNSVKAVPVIILGLFLPIFLPALLMLGLGKWMPNEIQYSGAMSLFILSIEMFIIAAIFTKILSLVGLSEKKLDELGFLGFTISTVTSFLAIYVGYFWMTNSGLTSVELTAKGILVIAIIATIILALLLKLLERMDKNEVEQ
ncbi:epimerase [Bacillus mobilis]|uniref:epimerase n=1 Tax=Bacillus mobilis TaxID=2026190 RepID=UPI002E221004|nr:epimerase [Bacillus mobilis]